MQDERVYFRRKLPHYQPRDATFFITFRLAGSLPPAAIERLRGARENELRVVGQVKILSNKIHEKYFAKYEDLLDGKTHGPTWLHDDRIAKVIADALHYWDGKRYQLLCYCIMPNHVHLVIKAGPVNNLSDYLLSPITHSIKRHTAREANQILQRTGAFWQHESYDHVVRDGNELERIIWYVLENPVKANLTRDRNQWKWSYIKEGIIDNAGPLTLPSVTSTIQL